MKDELEKQLDQLRIEYRDAKVHGHTRRMDEIRKKANEINKQIAAIRTCATCKSKPGVEKFGEGSYCSQECWDTYRRPPARHEIKTIEYMQKELLKMAKAKHVK